MQCVRVREVCPCTGKECPLMCTQRRKSLHTFSNKICTFMSDFWDDELSIYALLFRPSGSSWLLYSQYFRSCSPWHSSCIRQHILHGIMVNEPVSQINTTEQWVRSSLCIVYLYACVTTTLCLVFFFFCSSGSLAVMSSIFDSGSCFSHCTTS